MISTPPPASPVAPATRSAKPASPKAATVVTTKPIKATQKPATKKSPAVKKVPAARPAQASAPAAAKEVKPKKAKLVRDSFTIPKDEYAVIEALKQRASALAQPVKKSELLRAGLKVLATLSDSALRSALQTVPSIKTGRPKAEVPEATKVSTKPPAKSARK